MAWAYAYPVTSSTTASTQFGWGCSTATITYNTVPASVPPPYPATTALEWLAREIERTCARARSLA